MKIKSIGTRVTVPFYNLLESVSKEKGITISDVINDALEMYLSSLSNTGLTNEEKHYLTTTLIYQHLHLGAEIFEKNKDKIIQQTRETIQQNRTKG